MVGIINNTFEKDVNNTYYNNSNNDSNILDDDILYDFVEINNTVDTLTDVFSSLLLGLIMPDVRTPNVFVIDLDGFDTSDYSSDDDSWYNNVNYEEYELELEAEYYNSEYYQGLIIEADHAGIYYNEFEYHDHTKYKGKRKNNKAKRNHENKHARAKFDSKTRNKHYRYRNAINGYRL